MRLHVHAHVFVRACVWLCSVYECVHLCWKKQVLLCESLFVEDRIGIVNMDQFLHSAAIFFTWYPSLLRSR